ncbi:MAG: hypothetical protein AAF630_07650 [Cyanobacteria bacterium P01_C01_bin.38]
MKTINSRAVTQRDGNNAGRAYTPHFALIKPEENLHSTRRFLGIADLMYEFDLSHNRNPSRDAIYLYI